MPAGAAPPLTALVLAAGLGKRMRSKTIKLLHPVWGRPMVAWVLDAVGALDAARHRQPRREVARVLVDHVPVVHSSQEARDDRQSVHV